MLGLMLRNLTRRPLRTLFTITGVLLGTVAYVTFVSLAEGMRDQSQGVVDLFATDVTVTRAQTPIPWLSWLTPQEVAALRELPAVTSVSGVVIGTTRAGRRNLFFVFGAGSQEPLVKSLRIIDGRTFRHGTDEMIVGQTGAEQLELVPGDRIELAGRALDVVGIFDTGRGALDASAIVDLPLAQALFGAGERVNLAFVNVRSAADVPRTIGTLQTRFPRLEATPSALFTSRFAYVDMIAAYARAFASLALVLAAVMIANVVGMNVNERRQEIALLRSIGWHPLRIAVLIAGETALMIASGALLAIPVTAIALSLVDNGDAAWIVPTALQPMNAIEGVLMALGIGLFFALLPIADALRRRPAEALRGL